MHLFDPILIQPTTETNRRTISNYWKISDLKGLVKSIKISSFQTHVIDGDVKYALHLSSFLKYYAKTGHIEYALSLDQENNILWEYAYIWDLNKKLLRCKCFNAEKKIEEIYSYHFDENENLVCKRCFSPNGKLLWEQFSEEEDFQNDACLKNAIEHKFNETGEEVERRETSPSGSIYTLTFDYIYDHHQNWIKKIERTKPLNNITAITKRLIEYYDD